MVRLPPVAGLLLAIVAAAVCVRLGAWQLGRLEEKRTLNRALRAALASPPERFDAARVATLPADSLRVRRYVVAGTLDPRRHVVLVSRARDGGPGVEVVTPLAPDEGGPLLLVDRGFLPSGDGATTSPGALIDSTLGVRRSVVGFAEPLRERDRPGFLRLVERDSLEVWNAPWLDADSLAAALGAPVAEFVLRELPGPGVPASPARAVPVPFNEQLHLNYAVQWFSFAAIVSIGSTVLFLRSRRRSPEA
jgi:surfeit locus 1 family protein